jgi:hypothetical protein
MKGYLLILLFCCCLRLDAGESARDERYITCMYYPELVYRMGQIGFSGGDLMDAAKNNDQRRFLKAYIAVCDEERRKPKEDQRWRILEAFPWMEALRRCGIEFPEGTRARWIPIHQPFLVTHTAETMKRIEALMDLTLER